MVKSKVKFYAVAVGRKPGVYRTWKECQAQTSGFKKALFKSFPIQQDAQAFVAQHKTGPPLNHDNIQLSATSSDNGIHSSGDEPFSSSKRKSENNAGTENEVKIQKHLPNVDASLEIIIYFDGGSRGNPGVAGSGAHVAVTATNYNNPNGTATTKACSWEIREYIGNKATNNVAEYRGVLSGLKCAQREAEAFAKDHKRRWNVQVKVYGDSNLIINQLLGSNACKSPSIRPLYEQSLQIVNDMKRLLTNSNDETVVTISFQHVYRKDNSVADGLANEAMDQKRSWTTKDPCDESYENGNSNPGTDATACTDANMKRTDTSISKPTHEYEDV
eukprot:scaffold77843_cov52-Attheya_sp.AAC.4